MFDVSTVGLVVSVHCVNCLIYSKLDFSSLRKVPPFSRKTKLDTLIGLFGLVIWLYVFISRLKKSQTATMLYNCHMTLIIESLLLLFNFRHSSQVFLAFVLPYVPGGFLALAFPDLRESDPWSHKCLFVVEHIFLSLAGLYLAQTRARNAVLYFKLNFWPITRLLYYVNFFYQAFIWNLFVCRVTHENVNYFWKPPTNMKIPLQDGFFFPVLSRFVLMALSTSFVKLTLAVSNL